MAHTIGITVANVAPDKSVAPLNTTSIGSEVSVSVFLAQKIIPQKDYSKPFHANRDLVRTRRFGSRTVVAANQSINRHTDARANGSP
jgi:hypothetical protein